MKWQKFTPLLCWVINSYSPMLTPWRRSPTGALILILRDFSPAMISKQAGWVVSLKSIPTVAEIDEPIFNVSESTRISRYQFRKLSKGLKIKKWHAYIRKTVHIHSQRKRLKCKNKFYNHIYYEGKDANFLTYLFSYFDSWYGFISIVWEHKLNSCHWQRIDILTSSKSIFYRQSISGHFINYFFIMCWDKHRRRSLNTI